MFEAECHFAHGVRTIEQGVGKECGKASRDYFESVAVCYIDPEV